MKQKKLGRPTLLAGRRQTTVYLTDVQVKKLKSMMRKRDLRSLSAAVRFVLEASL